MEAGGKKRIVSLDIARALVIIFVVLGHSIETVINNYEQVTHTWYWLFAHFFNIPVFLFVSGFLTFGKLGGRTIPRRFLQLMIPFVIWTMVFYFWSTHVIHGFPVRSDVFKTVLFYTWTMDMSGLWFFPLLFALTLLVYLVRSKPWAILGIIAAAYLLDQVPWTQALHLPQTHWLNMIAWYMPFFAGGYFIAKYKDKLASFGWVKWACLAIFPALFFASGGLKYVLEPTGGWPAYTQFASPRVAAAIFYIFGMGLLGSGMILAVSDLLARTAVTRNTLIFVGAMTLGIYADHSLLRTFYLGSGAIAMVSGFVISMAGAVIMTWLLQKTTITNDIFLGGLGRFIHSRPRATLKPAVETHPTVS